LVEPVVAEAAIENVIALAAGQHVIPTETAGDDNSTGRERISAQLRYKGPRSLSGDDESIEGHASRVKPS